MAAYPRHPLSRNLPRRPQQAKRIWRTKAPAFDPALVSSTLSPRH